jgi:D-alanine-D-alanine ligase-like ATP-grasp enzyme
MRPRITQKEERISLVTSNVYKLGEGFRVFVKNTNVPKFIHASEEEAIKEAVRLAKETQRTTYVSKFLYEIKPEKQK